MNDDVRTARYADAVDDAFPANRVAGVMAVADAEQAELRAEVERLRAGIRGLRADWELLVHMANCGTPPSCEVRRGCEGNAGRLESRVLAGRLRALLAPIGLPGMKP
jgi:hypothetical protein